MCQAFSTREARQRRSALGLYRAWSRSTLRLALRNATRTPVVRAAERARTAQAPCELAPVSGPRGPGASGWPCQRGSQACCAAPPPSVPEERWWEPCSLEKEQTGDSPAVSLKCKCSLKKGVISNAKYEGRCIF